jgi:hypothetical protein
MIKLIITSYRCIPWQVSMASYRPVSMAIHGQVSMDCHRCNRFVPLPYLPRAHMQKVKHMGTVLKKNAGEPVAHFGTRNSLLALVSLLLALVGIAGVIAGLGVVWSLPLHGLGLVAAGLVCGWCAAKLGGWFILTTPAEEMASRRLFKDNPDVAVYGIIVVGMIGVFWLIGLLR